MRLLSLTALCLLAAYSQAEDIFCSGDVDKACPSGLCYDSINLADQKISSGCAVQTICTKNGCKLHDDKFVCCCAGSVCNGKSASLLRSRLMQFQEFKPKPHIVKTDKIGRLNPRDVPPQSSGESQAAEKANVQPVQPVAVTQAPVAAPKAPEPTKAPVVAAPKVAATAAAKKPAAPASAERPFPVQPKPSDVEKTEEVLKKTEDIQKAEVKQEETPVKAAEEQKPEEKPAPVEEEPEVVEKVEEKKEAVEEKVAEAVPEAASDTADDKEKEPLVTLEEKSEENAAAVAVAGAVGELADVVKSAEEHDATKAAVDTAKTDVEEKQPVEEDDKEEEVEIKKVAVKALGAAAAAVEAGIGSNETQIEATKAAVEKVVEETLHKAEEMAETVHTVAQNASETLKKAIADVSATEETSNDNDDETSADAEDMFFGGAVKKATSAPEEEAVDSKTEEEPIVQATEESKEIPIPAGVAWPKDSQDEDASEDDKTVDEQEEEEGDSQETDKSEVVDGVAAGAIIAEPEAKAAAAEDSVDAAVGIQDATAAHKTHPKELQSNAKQLSTHESAESEEDDVGSMAVPQTSSVKPAESSSTGIWIAAFLCLAILTSIVVYFARKRKTKTARTPKEQELVLVDPLLKNKTEKVANETPSVA